MDRKQEIQHGLGGWPSGLTVRGLSPRGSGSRLLYKMDSPPCLIHLLFIDHLFSAAAIQATVAKTSKQSIHGPWIPEAHPLVGQRNAGRQPLISLITTSLQLW